MQQDRVGTRSTQQIIGDHWLEIYEEPLDELHTKSWWKRHIRLLISLSQKSQGNVEEVKEVMLEANKWCSKLGYKNYTLAMVNRNYDKLKAACDYAKETKRLKEYAKTKQKQTIDSNKSSKQLLKAAGIRPQTLSERCPKCDAGSIQTIRYQETGANRSRNVFHCNYCKHEWEIKK